MIRREIPLPVAIGVIVLILIVVAAILWRQTSPPTEGVLKKWTPYPQIPTRSGSAPR
ncbi:MAG: hypothetical protein KatS3mg022_0678 [Armatimonadota bacterium]|nr:MAG: hypothetical protein KatS3mg022_0678 [Armatimonadota bacterium]